jgi:alkaline phosphatase
MPLPASFDKYSKIFSFDGRKDIKYTQKQSKRVELFSCSRFDFLKNPSKMKLLVDSVHAQNKKIRFWGFGNTFKDFEYQTQLGVDFVGTDSLQLLKKYIEQ